MTRSRWAAVAFGVAATCMGSGASAERLVEDADRRPRTVGADLEGPHAPMRRVLFLNFDGVDLQWCGEDEDDPHGDCSTIFQGVVLPYRGDSAARAAVVQTVTADLADFDVVVTTERPAEDIDYDMEMIGQWAPGGSFGFLGIAPKIDCFDGDGGDVSFTLDPPDLQPADTAKVVLQELAHTWGLEHVDSTGDLLFPSVGNAPDPKFEDQCSPITYEPDQCPRQHLVNCPEGEQNSWQEMLTLFGPRQPDETAPTVEIVSPSDGAHVPNDFHLVLELHDDIAPQVFTTSIEFVEGFTSTSDLAGPGVFPIALTGVEDGVWTVRVTTADPAGNESAQEITITVGQGEPPTVDESGGDGGTSAGPSDDDGIPDDETGAGESESGGEPQSGEDDGCGCASGGRGAVGAFVLMIAAGLRRRRT